MVLNLGFCRLFDERPARDITDTSTLSARPTLDTSSDRAKVAARMFLLFLTTTTMTPG